MTKRSHTFVLNLAGTVLAAALVLPTGAAFAAEAPSADDIIRALKPTRIITRGLDNRRPEETRFVDTLRNRPPRSLTAFERTQIAAISDSKPNIDLEITFEFNSATVGPKANKSLTELGKALSSDELRGQSFFINGYTDAKGDERYNQDLSERRADAVKKFLADKFGVEAGKLITVGYGKTRLKNPSEPLSPENRRVQVVNLADR